jgi:hypothetical protein
MRGPVPRLQPTPVRRHLRPRCISRSFGYVTQSAPLEHALELLFTAAETGAKADRKAATDQVAVVLKGRAVAVAPAVT